MKLESIGEKDEEKLVLATDIVGVWNGLYTHSGKETFSADMIGDFSRMATIEEIIKARNAANNEEPPTAEEIARVKNINTEEEFENGKEFVNMQEQAEKKIAEIFDRD